MVKTTHLLNPTKLETIYFVKFMYSFISRFRFFSFVSYQNIKISHVFFLQRLTNLFLLTQNIKVII